MMTDGHDNCIVIAGHSHVGALGIGVSKADCPLVPIANQKRIFGLWGPWPRNEAYWDTLLRNVPGNIVALYWKGNEYISLFLLEHPIRFDFHSKHFENHPVDNDSLLIAESIIRAKFKSLLEDLPGFLQKLKDKSPKRIVLIGAPPPKGDDDRLRGLMKPEFAYFNNPTSSTLENVKFTRPMTRLKLWRTQQDVYQEQADKVGADFLLAPIGSRDELGFLRHEYWDSDSIHANLAYGRLISEELAKFI